MPRPKAPSKSKNPELVSRAKLAEIKGVSRQAVSAACRPGGPLRDAVRGTKIALNDPAAIGWLAEPVRGPDGANLGGAAQGPTKAEMLELTRRKRAAEAEKLELANAQTREALISREFVRVHVIGVLESLFKRLLTDAAKSIAAKVFGVYRSNGALEEAQRIIREEISKQLSATKTRVVRAIRRRSDQQPAGDSK